MLGVDRVDQRVGHAQARVHLRGALFVAELRVESERSLQVADLAVEVAQHRGDLGERHAQPGARGRIGAGALHQRQRPLPVDRGLVPGEVPARVLAGAQGVLDSLGRVHRRAREPVVQRERGDTRLGVGAARGFDRAGRQGVHPLPARRAEGVVERLAHERVGERVGASLRSTTSRAPSASSSAPIAASSPLPDIAWRRSKANSRPSTAACESSSRHVSDRRARRRPRTSFTPSGHADLLGHRAGGPAAPRLERHPGLDQVAHHLLDEERVALGLRVDRLHQRRGRRVAGVRLDQRSDAAPVEALERHPLVQAVAPQVGQELDQRVPGGDVHVPVGPQDEQRGLVLRAHNVPQELERRSIGPVEVVEDEQHRGPVTGFGQQRGDRLEHQVAARLGIVRRRLDVVAAAAGTTRGSARRAPPRPGRAGREHRRAGRCGRSGAVPRRRADRR